MWAWNRSEEVLAFWFGTLSSDRDDPASKAQQWFRHDPAFDAEIRSRFGSAAQGR